MKSVLLVLADYASDTGKSFPSIKTFTRDTGLNEETVKLHLNRLSESGIITKTNIKAGEFWNDDVYQLNPVTDLKLEPPQPKQRKPLKNEALEEAMKVYEIYPRQVGKPKALTSIARCIKLYGFEVVFNGAKLFADAWKQSARTDINFCPHPATWFNRESFNDDPASWGLLKQVKIVTGIPSYSEMMAYAKEKDTDVTFCATAVTGFSNYWTKQKWQKNGNQLDWKNELANFLGRERARVANQIKTVGILTYKNATIH